MTYQDDRSIIVARIPLFFVKVQCKFCMLRWIKHCLCWGGPLPPVWTGFFGGLYHLCGTYVSLKEKMVAIRMKPKAKQTY